MDGQNFARIPHESRDCELGLALARTVADVPTSVQKHRRSTDINDGREIRRAPSMNVTTARQCKIELKIYKNKYALTFIKNLQF